MVVILDSTPFRRRKLLTLRGFLGFGGNGGYFWTVTLLPLNDAIVLTFLAPAWVRTPSHVRCVTVFTDRVHK